jgi:hypothetical protein
VRHFRVDPPQRVLATIDGTVRPATLTHWQQDDQGRWSYLWWRGLRLASASRWFRRVQIRQARPLRT